MIVIEDGRGTYEIQHPNVKLICEDQFFVGPTNKKRKFKNIITLLLNTEFTIFKLKYNMVKKFKGYDAHSF